MGIKRPESLVSANTEGEKVKYSPHEGERFQELTDAEKFPDGMIVYHVRVFDESTEPQPIDLQPMSAPHLYVSTSKRIALAEAYSMNFPEAAAAGNDPSDPSLETAKRYLVYAALVDPHLLYYDDEDTGHYDPKRPAYNWIIRGIDREAIEEMDIGRFRRKER